MTTERRKAYFTLKKDLVNPQTLKIPIEQRKCIGKGSIAGGRCGMAKYPECWKGVPLRKCFAITATDTDADCLETSEWKCQEAGLDSVDRSRCPRFQQVRARTTDHVSLEEGHFDDSPQVSLASVAQLASSRLWPAVSRLSQCRSHEPKSPWTDSTAIGNSLNKESLTQVHSALEF